MNLPKAILFDLYGTLLNFKQSAFIKALAQALDLPARTVSKKLLGTYLTRPFSTPDDMIRDLLQSLEIKVDEDTVLRCLWVLNTHLSRVSVIDDAAQLLAFFNACGIRIGLVSNSASVFKTPLYDTGLHEHFDCMIFSCDFGIGKPDPSIYLAALKELNVQAQDCWFVGDAWRNDYLAPRSLGMQALWIGKHPDPRVKCVERLRDIAWYSFQHQRPLLAPGDMIPFDNSIHFLASLETLAPHDCGKYNLVAKAELICKRSLKTRTVYIKRFSLQGSALLEQLAYSVYALVDATVCVATTVDNGEPLLITSEICGQPWDSSYVQAVAEQIGFHLALAYMFAHTDIRPRNLILRPSEDGLHIELIDMEHCFFAAALDEAYGARVSAPLACADLSIEEFERHTKFRPLALNTLKRVTRSFTQHLDDSTLGLFRQGWVRGFKIASSKREHILRVMTAGLHARPCPRIGTRGYRRDLTHIDIELLMQRVDEDPTLKLDQILGTRSQTFEYEYTVTMGDVNAMGNCYFLKYFELQGHVRELWLKQHVPDFDSLLTNHLLSTRSAHCDYKVPFYLYDIIVVRLHVSDLQRVSANLHFDFYRKGSDILHAVGEQRVVCKDTARKTCKMPRALTDAFSKFVHG